MCISATVGAIVRALAFAAGCLPNECGTNSSCKSPAIHGASGDSYGRVASMLVGTTQRIFADGASLVTKATLALVLPLASQREPAVLRGVSFDFSVAIEDVNGGFRYADENLEIATQGGSLDRLDWWRGAITTDASAANVTVALTSVALPTSTHVLPVVEEAAIDALALSNDAALLAGKVLRRGFLSYCPYSIATDHEIVNDRGIGISTTGPLTLDRVNYGWILASSRECYWLRGSAAGDATITLTRGAVQRVYTFRLE